MRPNQLQQHAAEFGISFQSACRMRIRYLLLIIDQWDAYIEDMQGDMPPSTPLACLTEIISIRNHEHRAKQGKVSRSEITDAMIQQAREYPIELVVEFNRGLALAFCHNDKTPSLTWNRKNNTCRCFPCDKSFNPIDVLMQRDGKSFIEAVKELQ